jgi:hypothetical protein
VKKVLNCWILNGGIGRGMCAVGWVGDVDEVDWIVI